ncbi:MAG: helix-turn-helix transcriptional regulator [Clostridia bacterium]|nr:helix-turn-helix transcriptional regulator [Clostridia bacterium]
MSPINKRIKEAVERSGLTYSEIEAALSLEAGTVEKWVLGKEEPDTQTVKELAPVIKTTADKLLFGVERIGEMKAMFPNDAKPAPTPMSDWRFLCGSVAVFTGVAGILLLVMRYAASGIGFAELFEVATVPVIALSALAVTGIIGCVFACISGVGEKKKKNNKKGEK